jgi:hypothetical protein
LSLAARFASGAVKECAWTISASSEDVMGISPFFITLFRSFFDSAAAQAIRDPWEKLLFLDLEILKLGEN